MSSDIDWYDLDLLQNDIALLKSQYPSSQKLIADIGLERRFAKGNYACPQGLLDQLNRFITNLYEQEEFTAAIPPRPVPYQSLDGARYRDFLLRHRHHLENPSVKLRIFNDIILDWIIAFLTNIEEFPHEGAAMNSVEALNLTDVREMARDICIIFQDKDRAGLFAKLQAQFCDNFEPRDGKPLPPIPEFKGSPRAFVFAYFHNTPFLDLLLTRVPVIVPEDIFIEQNRPPYDPDHPKHQCYQCHRPLPHDFAAKHWQELSYPRGPFFDVEKCQLTALNRHLYEDRDPREAYSDLVNEYELYVGQYERKKRAKDEEAAAKEEEKVRKEHEKEAQRLLEEQAFAELIKPRPIPEHLRIHTAVIAKTGWGKTQLLQELVLTELEKPDPPPMVVLDSTGAMVERIQRLALFTGRLKDRLLIIDPAQSPALNMFDISNPRSSAYSSEQQESMQTAVIGLFNYIFSSKDYDLSGQQGLGFTYAVRLILSRKGYALTDLRRLLEENPRSWEQSEFVGAIKELDLDARDFFQHHFYADALKATKAAIARRLHALIAIPAFRRMFTAGSNILDLYSETQSRSSIVLVNTNRHLLGRDGYVLFGRYVVARTMAAMLERSNIPQHQRRTTHLIIDEAAPYFDHSFDDLLTQVRQYGLKVTIAFQHLGQLDDKLRNSVAGQTSVKYVGGLSPLDEKRIAAQIRCEPEFISDLSLDVSNPPKFSEWAVYADGFTKHPMRCRLPFFLLENQPRMTDAEHGALLARNQARVAPKGDNSSHADSFDTSAPLAHQNQAPTTDPPPPALKPKAPTHSGESDPGEPAAKWGNS